MDTDRLTIVVSEQASAAERYAAEELQKYLSMLYPLEVSLQSRDVTRVDGPTVVVGRPGHHPAFADTEWPGLSADGFCLKTLRTDPAVLVVAGESARGTLFGVYELVERCGVRFLLSGDVLPQQPEPFVLTGFDECIEPAYPLRALRLMANLPEGAAAWGQADFTGFIDQMAKLKFNTFAFVIMESGPWLDYEFRGVQRPAGDIFYGYRFPIDDDFIGKELFDGASEFYSPVLAQARNDEEKKRLGIALVQSIIQHCKSRDLQVLLIFSFLEPPTLMKHQCNQWASLPLPDPETMAGAECFATPVEEFGINPQYSAWMNVADPVIKQLTGHRLKQLIDTYPEADFYHLWVSEHRAAAADCNELLRLLDDKYDLLPEFDWEQTLEAFEDSPFDRTRYQHQIEGDLHFLFALDSILNEDGLIRRTAKPDAVLGVAGVMPQLAPIAIKALPDHSVLVQFLDYGSHGTADQIGRLAPLLQAGVPITLEIGIHDDNNMYFPQANVESLERIVTATTDRGMQGYAVALWQVRQSDISAAYLGAASWRPQLTASQFYDDFFARLVGPAAAEDFQKAYRLIEAADREVKAGLLYGYAFPMTEKLFRTLLEQGVDRDGITQVRPQFQAACDHLHEASRKACPGGLPYVEFWLRRTQFAVDWLDLILAVGDLNQILAGKFQPDARLTPAQQQSALAALDGLLGRCASLIELIVADATHICDLGQIANINQHVYRFFKTVRADVARRAVETT